MRIVINGAGVAGPTLAYWLRRSGHEVLLVESAPRLRRGGYVIDFWGVGYDVAEKMGLLPRLRELGYQVREVRFVGAGGRRAGGFSTDVLHRMTHGRLTSLRRSDVAATIWEALDDGVETIFDDSVSSIEAHGSSVLVGFENAPPREADLVIGADGLHSRVRELAFGPEEKFEVALGYHVAAFELDGYRPRDELVYVSHGIAGKQISRFSMREDRTLVLLVFRDEYLTGGMPSGAHERQAALARIFADVGWEAPRILTAMAQADEIYFDRVSQIRMKRWTAGRTALVGDAAACVSLLAGEGTGLAIAEAYVLAGELHAARGDHVTAFARYEQLLRSFLSGKQRSAASFASSFAPKTELGVTVRNLVSRLFRLPFVADFLIGRDLRDDVALPDYSFPHATANDARCARGASG